LTNIRIRFNRGENVKFISHLDLMKVFERALRRSKLPVAYSQGFNPHPQMVFGLPLSVGVTSECEYADFELSEQIEPAEFIKGLNKELPMGIEATEAAVKTSKSNIMASIKEAIYEIVVFSNEKLELEKVKEELGRFLDSETIIVKKEGKAGIKDVNIRPMIHKLEVYPVKSFPQGYEAFSTGFLIVARLAAGSAANLKPELMSAAISEKTGIEISAIRVHRRELFVEHLGKCFMPMNNEVLI